MATRKKTAKRKTDNDTTNQVIGETITFATRFDSAAEKRLVAENRALRKMVMDLHLESVTHRIALGVLEAEKELDTPDTWTFGGTKPSRTGER